MTLTDSVRAVLGEDDAASFQLMGEELALVTGPMLREAGAAYESALRETVPAELRAEFEAEQEGLLRTAHEWLRRYNRNLHARVAGYLRLGRLCRWEYPWPVVAVLGICQVHAGLGRMRAFGLLGQATRRVLGYRRLEQAVDGIDDVLRRTNRGIFADSVPTVHLALRCHDLRRTGATELAEALLRGPLPTLFDEESRALARAICECMAVDDGAERFAALSALTVRHFGREQAIFTYHMGSRPSQPPRSSRSGSRSAGQSRLMRWMSEPRSVPAPVVVNGRRGRQVRFKPFKLPRGFDMLDHRARVELFTRAFVQSITGSVDDYEAAVTYALERFGKDGQDGRVRYPRGGARSTAVDRW